MSANTSGGHSSNSSPIGLPATACHVDASVGSRKRLVGRARVGQRARVIGLVDSL